jgi:N-acetyl-anhydromuramyl-L-alanine amidase AmpD
LRPELQIIQRPCSNYLRSETFKDLLVLHYTGGGTLAGAEAALSSSNNVNVAYMVDRDGTVYQYFDERYWAYHTGTGKSDAKRSIGIEVVNWGHLARKGDRLVTWTNKVMPWARAIRLEPFRGFEFWENLSPEQEETIPILVRDILSRWPGMRVTTHATIKPTKLDFPPGYPVVSSLAQMPQR